MTISVPWSTLRSNPRDQRETAAASTELGGADALRKKDEAADIVWDVTDFGRRMAFGGIVSSYYQPESVQSQYYV